MNQSVFIAFLFSTFAGLSTGIGSAIAFFSKKMNTIFLSISLGFSAGVMLYVSLVDLLPTSKIQLFAEYGTYKGGGLLGGAFLLGVGIVVIIDMIIPEFEMPHGIHDAQKLEDGGISDLERKKLLRIGMFIAVILGIHNFPEGVVTFFSALKDISVGFPIAVAIALHNIPEGIAVSIPIYFATQSRVKAFWISFLSGLFEPLGAILGYFFLVPIISESVISILFVIVAGMMLYISLDELLPASRNYGHGHYAIAGTIFGFIVMLFSMMLFS